MPYVAENVYWFLGTSFPPKTYTIASGFLCFVETCVVANSVPGALFDLFLRLDGGRKWRTIYAMSVLRSNKSTTGHFLHVLLHRRSKVSTLGRCDGFFSGKSLGGAGAHRVEHMMNTREGSQRCRSICCAFVCVCVLIVVSSLHHCVY